MDVEITPPPGDAEREAILAALDGVDSLPAAYASRWRAAVLDELRDDALSQERRRDPRVVEP